MSYGDPDGGGTLVKVAAIVIIGVAVAVAVFVAAVVRVVAG